MKWIEIHDQPWFPGVLRDAVTDILQFAVNIGNLYDPIVPELRKALHRANTQEVLDLCSGGGGPWPYLLRRINEDQAQPVRICLTDKYPNLRAFEKASADSQEQIQFCAEAVNAGKVPEDLRGFRTIFNSFHHFSYREARAILRNAFQRREGIGIFEIPQRDPTTILTIFLMPLAGLIFLPFCRPFRFSLLFWTYVLPLIPFVLWFDGVVSCFRSFTPQELSTLTTGLTGDAYCWEAGVKKNKSWPLAVTYLIGYPRIEEPVLKNQATECAVNAVV
jgi:hypothetical protein